jgi:hypothetical protein
MSHSVTSAPRALACASLLGMLTAPASVAATPPSSRPAIGRIGAGAQLGGFYDLADPALELRGWAKRLGVSLSWGHHYADPSESGLTEVSSEPGKQATAGVLFAFTDPPRGRAVPIKLYATAGVVHATQARGQWQNDLPPPGASFVRGGSNRTYAESAVEGTTGTGGYVGLGAEVGFRFLPGLSLGAELLAGFGGGEGAAPGVRLAVRYYPW